jgi:hypothetical protein
VASSRAACICNVFKCTLTYASGGTRNAQLNEASSFISCQPEVSKSKLRRLAGICFRWRNFRGKVFQATHGKLPVQTMNSTLMEHPSSEIPDCVYGIQSLRPRAFITNCLMKIKKRVFKRTPTAVTSPFGS